MVVRLARGRVAHISPGARQSEPRRGEGDRGEESGAPEQEPKAPAVPNGPARHLTNRHVAPMRLASTRRAFAAGAPASAPSEFVVGANADLGCMAENDAAGCVGANPSEWNRSTVSEPSIAVNGNAVLETWNWYAGFSTNGGATFTYVDPSSSRTFPDADGGFCCDQLAYYEPSRDVFIWVLQYCPVYNCVSGNNRIRVAVANGSAGLASGTWHYWDLTASALGAPGYWFDQPKISTSSNYAYIEVSAYDDTGSWHDSYVARLSLDALKNNTAPLVSSYATPSDSFSPGLAQGATDTMYFAAHRNSTTLRLFSWPESASVTSTLVANTNYPHTKPYSCPKAGQPYATASSASPSDWCPRGSSTGGYAHDDRINAGWVRNGVIGFSWDAGQGAASGGVLPVFTYPYVHVIRINETTKARIDEPIIYSPTYAIQWSSLVPNGQGDLGGTVEWGGNLDHENCGAVIHDSFTAAPTFWELHTLDSSNADTGEPRSGDYTTARPLGNAWAGGCYVLMNGGTRGYVHPRYVTFGREGTPPPLPSTFTLSVTKSGTGQGTVTSSPAGVTCGSTCSASFDAGAVVRLTATAPRGNTFAGWSGAGCSGKGPCTVTMSAAEIVHARFNLLASPPALLSAIVGPGKAISVTKGGKKVRSAAHGPFKITVQDKTKKDNFHLTCPGVNKKTRVRAKGTATWNVTLRAGTCTYRSDAHKRLKGSFRVT
jgi:hypothetical protein